MARCAAMIVLTALGATAACRERVPRAAARPGPPASPTEVVRALHETRVQRRFNEIAPYLQPGEAQGHVNVLLALDQVYDANQSLQAVIVRRFGTAPARAYDLSGMADAYGPLSRTITVLREAVDGDSAVVMLQQGDAVPLYRCTLSLGPDGWIVELPSPESGLEDRLRRIAYGLDRVRERAEKTGGGYAEFERAFQNQIWPILAEIHKSDFETEENDPSLAESNR
jgi:hypothetical protein